ncbi:MAG: hypothetical protein EBR82_09090 [Caulobacteraceae bacterium]|nr:hypothetical protein [Caulobacteraceae bacterium]
MENAARNFIVAVQNSLLGDLAGRLVGSLLPVLVVSSTLYQGDVDRTWALGFALTLCGGSVLVIFGAWLIGYIANRRLREPTSASIGLLPQNGFDAWREPSEEGLKPPAFTRRLVTLLGSGQIWKVVTLVLIAAFAAASVGVIFPEWVQSRLPGLSVNEIRGTGILIWVGALIPTAILRWASDNLKRLAPDPA